MIENKNEYKRRQRIKKGRKFMINGEEYTIFGVSNSKNRRK